MGDLYIDSGLKREYNPELFPEVLVLDSGCPGYPGY